MNAHGSLILQDQPVKINVDVRKVYLKVTIIFRYIFEQYAEMVQGRQILMFYTKILHFWGQSEMSSISTHKSNLYGSGHLLFHSILLLLYLHVCLGNVQRVGQHSRNTSSNTARHKWHQGRVARIKHCIQPQLQIFITKPVDDGERNISEQHW